MSKAKRNNGLRFQPTGIYEYNRVGVAMQHMVEDLHIAATVFESAEGMLVTDAQFVVLRANPAFSRMSGYSESEVVGKPLDCTLMPDSFASNRAAMQSALAEQGAWQGEMLGRRKNALFGRKVGLTRLFQKKIDVGFGHF